MQDLQWCHDTQMERYEQQRKHNMNHHNNEIHDINDKHGLNTSNDRYHQHRLYRRHDNIRLPRHNNTSGNHNWHIINTPYATTTTYNNAQQIHAMILVVALRICSTRPLKRSRRGRGASGCNVIGVELLRRELLGANTEHCV
jgi:hypothetical protein